LNNALKVSTNPLFKKAHGQLYLYLVLKQKIVEEERDQPKIENLCRKFSPQNCTAKIY